jgi:hypothetical protein
MTTHDLAIALAKRLEEEGVTDEEFERIIHDAEEEARLEIERIENMSAGEAEQELARLERKLERKESE